MATASSASAVRKRPSGRVIGLAVLIVVLIAMVLSVKVVDPSKAANSGVVDPALYGPANYPRISGLIIKKAVDVAEVAKAIKADSGAATKKYGTQEDASATAVFSVKIAGTAGKVDPLGNLPVTVVGMPAGVKVLVQLGPVLTGSEIRDATGTVHFSQFPDQTAYLGAATALNSQVKKNVLSTLKPAELAGKQVTVVGAFALSDPAELDVVPVKVDAK